MISTQDRLVRDSCLTEDLTQLGVQTGIFSLPEGAKRVFVGIAGLDGSLSGEREVWRIRHQVCAAVGTARETGTIFGIALRAEHGVSESTTKEIGKQRA